MPEPKADGEAALAAEDEEEMVQKRLGPMFWIPLAWLTIIVSAAILAPWLPIADYSDTQGCADVSSVDHYNGIKSPPSGAHPLGCDELGRDLLSRTIYGGRVSLSVGVGSMLFGIFIGGTFGLIAGFFGGRIEAVINFVSDVLLSFPPLLLALVVVTFTDQHTIPMVALVIGFVSIPSITRITRAQTLVYAQREFVLAARALGASNFRIIIREILPNIVPAAAAFGVIAVSLAILAEGALAFLGFSVQVPVPSWGFMLQSAHDLDVLENYYWIPMMPAGALVLTVLSLFAIGDRLRIFFDVKEAAI